MGETKLQTGAGFTEDDTEAFGLARDESIANADVIADVNACVAQAVGSLFYGIYHMWVKDGTYLCFREALVNILPSIGVRGDAAQAFAHYIENYVVEEDREAMRAFTCIDTLSERLAGVESISLDYRRNGLGWTRGQFIVSKRDDEGMPEHVLYVVSDITLERDLMARERTALFDAEHDALSGALNRKAFEGALRDGVYSGERVGFALLDVDDLKGMNDEHGHGYGDTVISEVGAALKSTFRVDDLVFRIGGDEFALVLRGCGPSCWGALCEKLGCIHNALALAVEGGEGVTLSVGVCFGDSGLQEWMYKAADEGLYHTKETGRAGCTLVDEAGTVVETWSDDDASVRPLAAMEGSRTGTGRMEIPRDGSAPRFFCGSSTAALYGMPQGLSPEESFEFWYERVDPGYREVLADAHFKMIHDANVECTFLWHGEGREPFFVRSVGGGEQLGDVDVIFGIHRSLENAVIVQKKDESELLVEAQNGVYISSCYVDIANDSFEVLKDTDAAAHVRTDGMGAAEAFAARVQGLTDEAYRDKMLSFVNLDTLPRRMGRENSIDAEFLTSTGIGWCRASWLPVKRDDNGVVTHAMYVVADIDAAKEAEIEREREAARFMGLHYEAAESVLDSKIVGMGLFDTTTGEGQIWGSESGFSRARTVLYDDLVVRDIRRLTEANCDRLIARLDRATIVSELEEQGRYVVGGAFRKKDGTTLHLKYHFSAYDKDATKIFAVIEDDTLLCEREGRTIESLFARVPGGLVTYEWDGENLVVVNMSSRYEERCKDAVIRGDDGRRLVNFDRIHPDDRVDWKKWLNDVRASGDEFHSVYRVWDSALGRYAWEQVDGVFDRQEDGSLLVYAMYTDVTELMETRKSLDKADRSLGRAMDAFQNRMDSLVFMHEDALSLGVFNISEKTVVELRATSGIFSGGIDFGYDEALEAAASGIRDEDDRRKYLEMFSAENILEQMAHGEMRLSMECFYTVSPGNTEWVEISADLLSNPTTGDVESIGVTRIVTKQRLAALLASRFSSGALSSSAVLLDDGDEYYVFDNAQRGGETHRTDYWTSLTRQLRLVCSEEEALRVEPLVSRGRILSSLASGQQPKVAFHATSGGLGYRMQLAFTVLDEARGLVLATVQNITDDEMVERIRHEARHDRLTGLYNRQTAFAKCRRVLEEHPDETFVMLKLNVRRFRMYNEFFGEEAGDELLKTIANGMRKMAPAYDCGVYGRVEADVFFGFFPLRVEILDAQLAHVWKRFLEYRRDFLLEPSVGMYVVNDRNLSIEAMFARASSAAKEGGTLLPNGARCYNEQLERDLESEIAIVRDMHEALELEQFQVYLQPKFDLQGGDVAGAEALVRWDSPTRGLVSPAAFIPVFEGNGFIAQLDQYMWEHVCQLLRRWVDEGREVQPVSVNVSRLSAYSPSTVPFLIDLVQRYGLDPALMELELTETAYIDDPEEIERTLGELQRFGFKILMDDFGSGYSSLNTLRKLPVDVLKLDMAFMTEACDDARGRAVLSSVVAMAKLLELPVVAEGVETEQQAEYLRSLGCEYVQGFLFAKPMPVSDYEQLTNH